MQIELTTLENTVTQLEKQKGEAEKRLEALDSQIAQLGRSVEQSREKVKEEEKRLSELHSQSTQNGEDKTVNIVKFSCLRIKMNDIYFLFVSSVSSLKTS